MTGISLTVETAQLGTLEILQAPAEITVLTAETVVIEVPALQGPAGPPGSNANDDQTDYAALYLIAKL